MIKQVFRLLFTGLSLISLSFLIPTPTSPDQATPAASFYDLSVTGIEGELIQMKDFKGKFVLCVNVASKCGYTPQYEPLQQLYDQFQDKLVIIGFPCNQFMGQEPKSEAEIVEFCQRNYGVTFPMTEKIKVKGKEQHPVYAWLTQASLNDVQDAKVGWNFNKFLISPEGKWLAHFPSKVDPLSEEITGYLED